MIINNYLRGVILLTLAYLAFTSNLQLSNVVIGVVLAGGVMVLLRPEVQPLNVRNLPAALWALLRYVLNLASDLIVSGIQVARIVLDPALPIRPGIVAIPSECESDLARALSMHAITITPGEMVVEVDEEGVMYTHCLDATRAAEYAADAQAMRRQMLEQIFE